MSITRSQGTCPLCSRAEGHFHALPDGTLHVHRPAPTRMADIGVPQREVTFEPLTEPAPVEQPVEPMVPAEPVPVPA